METDTDNSTDRNIDSKMELGNFARYKIRFNSPCSAVWTVIYHGVILNSALNFWRLFLIKQHADFHKFVPPLEVLSK
jgi:hypothetical protein